MNKTTIVMLKVVVARYFIITIGSFFLLSCSNEQSNDVKLFNIILKESNYVISDSVFLEEITDTERVNKFFISRNSKRYTFRQANKDGTHLKYDDSLSAKFDTIIREPVKINSNKYLTHGKGINNEAEIFLKDSFNYLKDSNNWNFKKMDHNIFPENQIKKGKKLAVSKPVYNLKKDKAIIFKKRSIYSGAFVESIYLFQKNENEWELVFKQKKNTHYIGGLKKGTLIE